MHVDDWLDDIVTPWEVTLGECYARWWLEYARQPAWKQMLYRETMSRYPLFCTYEGQRYRVTGASRMGDVWLAKDAGRESGYDLRVEVTRCSEWAAAMASERRSS